MNAPSQPSSPSASPTGAGTARTIGWIAAAAAWVAAAVARAPGSAGTAQFSVGVAWRLAGTLAVGSALRWLYLKGRSSDAPVLSPWLLVVAAAIGLAFTAPGVAERSGSRVMEADTNPTTAPTPGLAERGGSRVTEADTLLAELPAGHRYVPMAAQRRREVEDRILRPPGPDDYALRDVSGPGGRVGWVVVVVLRGAPPAGDDALEGAARGLRDAGGKARIQPIAGRRFAVGKDPAGVDLVLTTQANASISIYGRDAAAARRLATAFARALGPQR